MKDKIYHILFLCTGNSARSIMAEALLNTRGKGRFRAFSAGSYPVGRVHPLAIELIKTLDYPLENLRSKSWHEFTEPSAPAMDFIITVCDNAAAETCPIWPGQPIAAHWGFMDPAQVVGNDEEKRFAFKRVFQQISKRIDLLVNISLESLDQKALQAHLKKIGETDEP